MIGCCLMFISDSIPVNCGQRCWLHCASVATRLPLGVKLRGSLWTEQILA